MIVMSKSTASRIARMVIAGILAVGLVSGCASTPEPRPPEVVMLTGVASAAEGAISVESGGWTYSVPLDVAWTDDTNSWHEGDRPGCLPPGANRAITFAAVEVTVEGMTWRPVVWVSCR